jgi:hypothetical protein
MGSLKLVEYQQSRNTYRPSTHIVPHINPEPRYGMKNPRSGDEYERWFEVRSYGHGFGPD